MLLLTHGVRLAILKKTNNNQPKTGMGHKDFNLSIKHEFNEVAKTKQTPLVSHWQFVNFPDPLFQNYIKYDIVACKSNSNAYKNQQIFVLTGVIKFQMAFGVLWNDKCMLILKNGQNQISWGDNSHINYHKINSDICMQ